MLIDCPQCHSVYRIPDKLIGKTGKKFRCQVCSNIWHAMPEDALDYEAEELDKPYIEPILVKEPPHRNYPANKEKYQIPADTKSGKKTRSSKDIIEDEGTEDYIPIKTKTKKEITLTSDQGTSFTISASPEYNNNDTSNSKRKTPHLFEEDTDIHADVTNRLAIEKPYKGYVKTRFVILLLILISLIIFLRREIVIFYPKAENWYNKIRLSGLNNQQYLNFSDITVTPDETDKNTLLLKATINNTSHFNTYVPHVTINNNSTTYKPQKDFLKSGETTYILIKLPVSEKNEIQSLILKFKHP